MASLSNITLSVRANIDNFQKRLNVAEKKVSRLSRKFSEVGKNLTMGLTVPMGIAGGAALKAAADYEEAITEIEKVSDKETASKLEGQIKSMAASIPLAQKEIAKLASDAARFGVEGSKNIEQFTRTVAKMSFTTDLSAQEAGKSLAKIADQTDTPISEIDRLGSTIVKLGDSMATSQKEIVDSMSRGAIAARNFGLSGESIAGLSARINEVSESAERAGTRLRRIFQELQEPKKVQKVASALGMTADEFRAMRKESPEKALMAVVNAIEQGGAKGREMANIFATSSRAALRGLASDSGALRESLAKASDEFESASELNRQFSKQTDTFNAKLQMAFNRLRNVGITIGNILMPHVLDLISGIQRVIGAFQSLDSSAKNAIVKFGLVAAAAGPLLFILGKLAPVAMVAFKRVVTAAQFAARGISAAFASTGIGLLVIAIGAAAAAIIAYWDEVKAAFMQSPLPGMFKQLGSIVKTVAETIIGAFKVIYKKIAGGSKETSSTAKKAFKVFFQGLKNILKAVWSVVKTVFNSIFDIVLLLWDNFKNVFQAISDLLSGNLGGAFGHFRDIWKNMALGVINIVQNMVTGVIQQMKDLVSGIPGLGAIEKALGNAKESVNGFAKDTKEALNLTAQQENLDATKNKLKALLEEFKKAGAGALDFSSLFGGGGGEPEKQDQQPLTKQERKSVSTSVGTGGGPQKAPTIEAKNIEAPDVDKPTEGPSALQQNMGKIQEVSKKGANLLQQGARGAKNLVTDMGSKVANSIAPGLGKAVGPILNLLGQNTNQLRKQIRSFAKAIPKVITLIIKNVPVLITEILKGVPLIINGLIKGIPHIVQGLINGIPLVIKEMVLLIPRMIEDIFNIDLGIGSNKTRPSEGGPSKELRASVSGDQMQFTLDEDKKVKERMGQQ